MVVELENYDILNPKECVKVSKLLDTYTLKIKGIDANLEIRELDSFFIAVSDDFPGKVLGYYDFRFPGYSFSDSPIQFLHDVSPVFMNSGLLVVSHDYIGNKIGTLIHDQVKKRATSLEKVLLVLPGRPGGELPKEERDKRFPYSTEQLRSYYLRHGFTEFEEEEAKRCVLWLDCYKDRLIKMLDSAIGFPDDPPLPEPVFGHTNKERFLKFVSNIPIIKDTPWVQDAVHKRKPMDSWYEEYDRKRLYDNENCRYVMSHLYYNNVGVDIKKVSPFDGLVKKL